MDIIYIYLFIVGAVFGSFFDCIANRLSRNESIITPRSHCEKCGNVLHWYELIPILSYLLQKGRCKKCRQPISIEYLLAEVITGILFAFSYNLYGFTLDTIISIVVVSVVIITFISDSKYMVILDEALIVGSIILLILYYLKGDYSLILMSIISALILSVLMLLIKVLGDKAFKQESLGWGDIKLSMFAGIVLGWKLGLVYIFLGSLLALPYALYITYRKKEGILPFGPFLATAILFIYWNMDRINNVINLLIGVQS